MLDIDLQFENYGSQSLGSGMMANDLFYLHWKNSKIVSHAIDCEETYASQVDALYVVDPRYQKTIAGEWSQAV